VPAPFEHRSLRTLVSFAFALVAAIWATLSSRRLAPAARLVVAGDSTGPRVSVAWMTRSMVILTVADLLWVAYGFNPTVPARVDFPAAPPGVRHVVANARGGRVLATKEILAPNLAMVYGLRDLRGYDFPLDRRWAKLYRRLGWQSGITLLPDHQVQDCVRPAVQSVSDKCSVRFLYKKWTSESTAPPAELPMCEFPQSEPGDERAWRLVYRGTGAAEDAVYENTTAYSRAYFAREVVYAAGESALDAVLDVQTDLREVSFVEEPLDSLDAASDRSPGEAVIELDEPEEVRVRTRSTVAALLVLSDRFDPNWQVEIDGKPSRALRANYLFRGVVVPAGEHVVRWRYRLASLWWGSAATLLTLVALTALLFVRPNPLVERRV
jgi:hypothetical protein